MFYFILLTLNATFLNIYIIYLYFILESWVGLIVIRLNL